MNPNETENALTLLTKRMERLEKQNKWWIRTALVLGAVLLMAMTLGATQNTPSSPDKVRTLDLHKANTGIVSIPPPIQEMIRTKDLQLVDGDGNVRGELSLVDGKPNFNLIGTDGKTLASFSLFDAAPGISPPEGEPGFFMYDKDGKLRVEIRLQDGNPLIITYDPNGKVYFVS
jgi:hypothetical protein